MLNRVIQITKSDKGMNDEAIMGAARHYMGKAAWPTIIMATVLIATYITVFALGALKLLPLWLCFLAIAYLLYALYTPLHEAVHNNISGKSSRLRPVNHLIGYVTGSILGIPYTLHRSAHMAHHRATNVPGQDPDHVFAGNSLLKVLTGCMMLIISEYRMYFGDVFPQEKMPAKLIVIAEITVMIGWRIGLAFAGFPLAVFILGFLANGVGITFIGAFFAWIVHTPFDKTERYENTSTIILPNWVHGPVTCLWLWQNYHSIHHLFPRVPFYRYRKLFDEIREGMVERGAPIVDLQSRT